MITRGVRRGCSFFSSIAPQHVLALLAWLATVAAGLPSQAGNLLPSKLTHFAAQCSEREPFAAAVGQRHFLLAQVLEKPVAFSRLDFVQQDRGQQRTPKDGPVIIGIMHFFSLQGERMSSSLECQATSVEPRTCCESGEERTTETAFPLGHDQQKLPSRFQRFHPLLAYAVLEGIDPARNSMTGRVGIVLQDHLALCRASA